jgi:hypothetical protein
VERQSCKNRYTMTNTSKNASNKRAHYFVNEASRKRDTS